MAERIIRNRVDLDAIDRLLAEARFHVRCMCLFRVVDAPSHDEIDAMEPQELRAIAEAVLATPVTDTAPPADDPARLAHVDYSSPSRSERRLARQVLAGLDEVEELRHA